VLSLQLTAQENKSLKDQNEDLKQQVYQSSVDKTSLIQKLKLEISLLRDKESTKIESLEEDLYAKQEEIDKLLREFRAKEKEYQELIANLRAKMAALDNEREEALRNEQRKVEKLEKELNYKSESFSESQINTDSLLKENNRLKEETYRFKELANAKELELKSLGEKYKKHLQGCRRDTASKDKECH